MGTSTAATWLFTGTSGGVFRGGIQVLDAGGAMRQYLGANYLALDLGSGATMNVSNIGVLTATSVATGTVQFGGTITLSATGANSIVLQTNVTTRVTVSTSAVTLTIPLLTADGTAGAPSHSFSNSTTMGMYRIDANNLGWAVGGAEQMRLAAGLLTVPDIYVSSDRRMKESFESIEGSLSITHRLRGYTFIHKKRPGRRMAGLVAQDLVGYYDTAVHTDENGFLSVSYLQVVPLLVNAVNDVDDKVTVLERKVARLENEVAVLRARPISGL
jgi:hypothetical protein